MTGGSDAALDTALSVLGGALGGFIVSLPQAAMLIYWWLS